MMLGNKCRGSGTCTTLTGTGTPKQNFNSGQVVPVPLSPVPVPLSKKSTEAKWYRYRTYGNQYRHVIIAGFEQNSNSGARVRSSFDHQLEITMGKVIKAKGKGEKATWISRVLFSSKESVFS